MLRLLVPELDRERPAYGIKTNTLGKLIIRILAIDVDSDVAKRLTRKNDPSAANSTKTTSSDYASVVFEVMKNRASNKCRLTVYDVNQRLDSIARNNETGSRRKGKDTI